MSEKDGTGEVEEAPPLKKKSKSPTWIGQVIAAKDEAMTAVREAADDKMQFLIDRLEAESAEREKRSQVLYEISQARADDMQKSSESKDVTIKRLWIANVIQMFILAALAGVTVTGNIPGFGDIGLDAAEQPAKEPAEEAPPSPG